MLKKIVMVVMAFTLFFAFTVQDSVDAKGRIGGSYRSGVKSHTTTPNKSTTKDNVSKSSTGSTTGGTAASTANRGFFSGGSFMKGMMIGGLSGLLFGSLFASMGGFGNLLGLALNIFAIYLVVVIAAALFRRFSRPRKPDPRDGRY
ncbi:hypothetical protein AWM70_11660 [Paenibacillus yonginensis]|uniref:Preprotein translocase subunit Tim44 n=1 Tax=Paenibacillus yonginensis TaxID=1462996 RepID=A0A1B1N195_9BACL|nr:hypothetical protein [Paenibacillus yonginensis]ANS75178.1 hypothetical protein AWM70_11660 [Paenibacillus yonginensis]